MKKTQITSPLLLLGIIILSTTIIITQNRIESTIAKTTISQARIINDIKQITKLDLEYQLYLTKQTIQQFSTINSSGTIKDILSTENQIIIEFGNEVWLNYTKRYELNELKKTINNILMVPYPYLTFIQKEQELEEQELKNCMGTDCSNFISCVNELDTEYLDFGPEQCISNPLRIKITITHINYPLTLTNPYFMWNNSLKNI